MFRPAVIAIALMLSALTVTIAASPGNKIPSIVSLAPSNTELLVDTGAEGSLVGVCSNCATHLSSVKTHLKEIPVAGSFVAANLERLTQLKPDVVLVVNGQEAIQSMLKKRGFNVVLLNNNKLSDIPANLATVGQLSKTEGNALKLSSTFAQALKELSAIMGGTKSKPKVFYCIWPQPLLTIGKTSFLNDVITACGGTNISDHLLQAYPHFSAERLIMDDPDVIVLPYEAKSMALFKRFPWNKLRAVRENRLFYLPAPKEDLLARPTMNILRGLYWLAIKIHPELSPELGNWQNRYNTWRISNPAKPVNGYPPSQVD